MKHKKSLLISSFEAFYLMLVEAKKQIEKNAFFLVNDSKDEKESKIAAFQNRLYVFVKEKDSMIAYEDGKLASDAFQEVVYVMISLADELFLSFDWDGKKYWRTHLLEQKFFSTNQAGEKLLTNLDKFLQERHVQDSEIGLIYLYALALGFQGKLRYEADIDFYLHNLKEQVFYTIYKQSPKLYKKADVLFSQATENVFIEKAQSRDTTLKWLFKMFIVCGAVYLFASHVLWHVETHITWKLLKHGNNSKSLVAAWLDNVQNKQQKAMNVTDPPLEGRTNLHVTDDSSNRRVNGNPQEFVDEQNEYKFASAHEKNNAKHGKHREKKENYNMNGGGK